MSSKKKVFFSANNEGVTENCVKRGNSTLHEAASEGLEVIVRKLVESGANVDGRDEVPVPPKVFNLFSANDVGRMETRPCITLLQRDMKKQLLFFCQQRPILIYETNTETLHCIKQLRMATRELPSAC